MLLIFFQLARMASLYLVLLALLALASARAENVFVYLMAGQSNAEGQAEVATVNKSSPTGAYLNGTLAYQLRDPRTAAQFAPLWDASTSNWTVSQDVFVWYNEFESTSGVNGSNIPSQPGEATFGPLSVGFGCAGNPNLIGPELGFGFGMAEAHPGQKILIVKTAWGGKTLAEDFRPPSSVASADPYCQGACPNQVGHFYRVMVEDLHKMLAPGAIAAMFPDLAGYTPLLSGAIWWQGWNDGCDLNQTAAYETNLVNLVKDVRAEFGNPTLPFSVAASGFNGCVSLSPPFPLFFPLRLPRYFLLLPPLSSALTAQRPRAFPKATRRG